MKRIISALVVLSLAISIFALSACSGKNSNAPADGQNKKLKIVTTIFPEYDWVREILGDKADGAELTMLLDNGVDLHSYQPTVDDILKISNCDVFIYVGGESDEWVDDALKEAVNKNMTVINLLDVLGDSVKEEEVKEGMQAEHEEEAHEAEGEAEEEVEFDEHVWLSLKNAQVLVKKIAEAIAGKDSANADSYLANADSYIKKLSALDGEYAAAVNGASKKVLLFGDRFPFRYMTDDYGLDYYAAFVGCSAETEASFETIAFLAGKLDELSLNNVMIIESSDGKIAKTIIDSSKNKAAEILTLDSLQSTTSEDVAGGTTYISVMQKNLDVLKQALA
ncbi:MAG: zinc ABC transporter substrate-binding protein [Clostridia bacterium]|nr:zinc ABC transporter substrate-binding protein [Clostridia bacterium]